MTAPVHSRIKFDKKNIKGGILYEKKISKFVDNL